jgi:hypothetical protein
MKTIGYAAQAADTSLAPFALERRALRPVRRTIGARTEQS